LSSGIDARTVGEYVRKLERYAGYRCITRERLVSRRLSVNEAKALRKYARFLYEMGRLDEDELDRWLRLIKIPRDRRRYVAKSIDAESIAKSFEVLEQAPGFREYYILYKVLYFSGARLEEGIKLLTMWNPSEAVENPITGRIGPRLICFEDKGFCRYGLFWYRGHKRCDYIYMPIQLAREIEELGRVSINAKAASTYYRKHGVVAPKMLRKLFYQVVVDATSDRELADFYESRIPRAVGPKHYDDMQRRADREYPRILAVLRKQLSTLVARHGDSERWDS